MSNDYYIEGYNVKTIGDGQSYELTAASNCTCTDGKCKTYNGYCNFSFSFKPNEVTDAYTVFVSGMPKPLDSYYHFTVSDTNGNSYPAYIDNSGFKLRRASGTSTIFASGVYRV